MNTKTVLNNITYAEPGSTIIINLHTTTIKFKQDNTSLVTMDDDDTIYIADKNNREYYIFTPSIEAIRIIGDKQQ